MLSCPTCGSSVPDSADVCPDCGMELQANTSSSLSSTPFPTVTPSDNACVLPDLAPPVFPDADFSFDSPRESSNDARTVALDPNSSSAPANSSTTATLTLKRGGVATTDVFTIGGNTTIGRFDPESGPIDVDMGTLPEAVYVSRHHAELRCEGGQWRIRDLGSRNGTFVRSNAGQFQRISDEQAVNDGDEISLGNARFEFRTA